MAKIRELLKDLNEKLRKNNNNNDESSFGVNSHKLLLKCLFCLMFIKKSELKKVNILLDGIWYNLYHFYFLHFRNNFFSFFVF